jgi:peptidoglycan/xylan/chitin deacetylase (PgdA/CDA1 family)
MSHNLKYFVELLKPYGVAPSFPIVGIVLNRQQGLVQRLHQAGVEWAAHGWTHISVAQLSPDEQAEAVKQTQVAFNKANIPVTGFRSPYLSRTETLSPILQQANFSYVSNQPIFWPVVQAGDIPKAKWASYQQALDFYSPWSSAERASTPRILSSLVEVPVALPDDEMLVDRLDIYDKKVIAAAWQEIFRQIYEQGGVFTLQLHPERITYCDDALIGLLCLAQSLNPPVWLARLAEIADWWRTWLNTEVIISSPNPHIWDFRAEGPAGLFWLVRHINVLSQAAYWADGYYMAATPQLTVQASVKPIIGMPPETSSTLILFLRQHGYLVEITTNADKYSLFLTQNEFDPDRDERSLLNKIEQTQQPLVKLGCWPNGTRCALSITGDVDALALWDYVWRLFGR